MSDPSANLRGILAMCAAMAAFMFNDGCMKALSSSLPLGQMIFVRGLFASGLVISFCLWSGAFRTIGGLADRLVVFRLVGEVGGTVLYLTGLMNLPVADAAAIFQVTPLAVTAGAAVFLGVHVGWRRWTAVLVGFFGVMLIVRPGFDGFDPASFAILGSVGFVVLRDLATARIPAKLPTEVIAATTAVVMTICGFLLGPLDGLISPVPTWQPLDLWQLALLATAGVGVLGGYSFLTIAMRTGDLGAVGPFRYSILVWSFLIGIVFFGERPDAFVYAGAAVVVATGLYTFQRERSLARAAAARA